MLLTTLDELTSVYPTSQWDNIDLLIPLFLRTERTKLAKYLGLPLLDALNTQYREILDQYGTLQSFIEYSTTVPDVSPSGLPSSPAPAAVSTPLPLRVIDRLSDASELVEEERQGEGLLLSAQLISTCQELIVYITLSNNTRILTSSLNQGGGFNTMVASDYDQSSDSQLKALSQELWHNAMDSLDSLLILLEQDAQSEKLFTDMWKHSNYYYLHSDLIFRTADELSHYLPIEGGRASYIQLTPGLRNAQNQYIEPRIGSDLVRLLCLDTIEAADDALKTTPEVYDLFSRHVRTALANYANIEMLRLKGSTDKNSTQSRARSEMQNDYHEYGDREMGLALQVIFDNPTSFAPYINRSRILQYEYKRKLGEEWSDPTATPSTASTPVPDGSPSGSSCSCLTNRTSHDSLFDLGGWHLN